MADRGERQLRAGKLLFEVDRELRLSLGLLRATLPYPRHGYGGHALVVSPDERYLALHLYSGQSEEGWELFELPSLRHLASLPYFHGEGTGCRFSPGARWLATFTSTAPRVRDTGEYFEDVQDPDADDELVVDWAELRVQRVPDGPIERHTIGARVARSMDPDELSEWNTYDALSFAGDDAVALQMPWGDTLTVALPIAGAIVAPS
ncbi:MAG: hypothetical protein ACM31C_20210 [Acidobacteriota bacterium]